MSSGLSVSICGAGSSSDTQRERDAFSPSKPSHAPTQCGEDDPQESSPLAGATTTTTTAAAAAVSGRGSVTPNATCVSLPQLRPTSATPASRPGSAFPRPHTEGGKKKRKRKKQGETLIKVSVASARVCDEITGVCTCVYMCVCLHLCPLLPR